MRAAHEQLNTHKNEQHMIMRLEWHIIIIIIMEHEHKNSTWNEHDTWTWEQHLEWEQLIKLLTTEETSSRALFIQSSLGQDRRQEFQKGVGYMYLPQLPCPLP